jgi:hypothetical protein
MLHPHCLVPFCTMVGVRKLPRHIYTILMQISHIYSEWDCLNVATLLTKPNATLDSEHREPQEIGATEVTLELQRGSTLTMSFSQLAEKIHLTVGDLYLCLKHIAEKQSTRRVSRTVLCIRRALVDTFQTKWQDEHEVESRMIRKYMKKRIEENS